MNKRVLIAGGVLAALASWWAIAPRPASVPKVDPCPDGKCPVPAPTKPKPRPRRPWGEESIAPVGAAIGGPKHADGTEIACDLPGELHKRNIGSPPPNGPGCCVFRSLDHAAQWQQVPALYGFPEWMVKKGVVGGGYPDKVRDLIPRISKDRGMPEPSYLQWESNDLELLKAACKSGRMPCVTYAHSPTGRYGGQSIAHMVNIVHADDKWFVVLDNNYVGADAYEWMTPQEFLRTYSGGSKGWSIVILSPPPPPIPRN